MHKNQTIFSLFKQRYLVLEGGLPHSTVDSYLLPTQLPWFESQNSLLFSEEILMLLRIIYGTALKSGQRINNVDQTMQYWLVARG